MGTPAYVGVDTFDPSIHKIPVMDDAQAQEIIDREFDPEIHKAPVTKEFMAFALGGHVDVGEELLDHFKDALFEGVAGMIYSIARKYSINSPDEVGDLANDCVCYIWRQISKYDPTRASFNTWAWRLSENKLRRNYQKARLNRERYVEWNDVYDNYGEEETTVDINSDIAASLAELLELYPDKSDIICEIFFRIDGSMYVPERVSMKKISRSVNREYPEVYSFVRDKLRPFFKKKFGGLKK